MLRACARLAEKLSDAILGKEAVARAPQSVRAEGGPELVAVPRRAAMSRSRRAAQ